MALKPRSESWNSRPCSSAPSAAWCGCRKRLHSIGVSVSDTRPDTRMAAVMVTANSCSRRPRMPPMNSTGMNTATSDSVIDRIVKPISPDP